MNVTDLAARKGLYWAQIPELGKRELRRVADNVCVGYIAVERNDEPNPQWFAYRLDGTRLPSSGRMSQYRAQIMTVVAVINTSEGG